MSRLAFAASSASPGRSYGTCIRLHRAQGVRHILECGNDSGPVLGLGLIQRRLRGLLFVVEREAVENRRGHARRHGVKSGPGLKALRKI